MHFLDGVHCWGQLKIPSLRAPSVVSAMACSSLTDDFFAAGELSTNFWFFLSYKILHFFLLLLFPFTFQSLMGTSAFLSAVLFPRKESFQSCLLPCTHLHHFSIVCALIEQD